MEIYASPVVVPPYTIIEYEDNLLVPITVISCKDLQIQLICAHID